MRKVALISSIVLLLVLGGCRGRDEPETAVTPTAVVLTQWASSATASSAYGMPDWSAQRATGEPDVEGCVDDSRAWASARGNGLEWLDLRYDTPVYATGVQIYQTLGRGSIARVILIDEGGEEKIAWQGTDTTAPCPGVFSVEVSQVLTRTVAVRVELDESRTGFWNQIDAVSLSGIP